MALKAGRPRVSGRTARFGVGGGCPERTPGQSIRQQDPCASLRALDPAGLGGEGHSGWVPATDQLTRAVRCMLQGIHTPTHAPFYRCSGRLQAPVCGGSPGCHGCALRRSSQGLHTVRANPREGSQRRESPPMREERRDRSDFRSAIGKGSEGLKMTDFHKNQHFAPLRRNPE